MKLATIITTGALGLGILAGCGEDAENATAGQAPQAEQAEPDAGSVTSATAQISDLVTDPARFAGQEITVTGDVEGATNAPTAFALTEPRSEQEIIVLPTEAAGDVSGVVSNERVTVSGRVAQKTDDLADRADFLFEAGENAGRVLEDIEDPYVLIADRVRAASG